MKNTRTLISSSLVSLIIVILGMFMLCMSRAPKISFDEPLIEGGGIEPDSVGVDDQDFLSLLDDSDDNQALTEYSGESASSDDDLLSLLEDDDQNTTSYEQSSNSGDEGMDEILRLLELDEDSGSQSQTSSMDSDALDELLADDTAESATQPDVSNSSQQMASIDELSKEVEHLENLLSDKTSQVENLQTEINTYDQQITDYQQQSPSRNSSNRAPVRTVSNYESTPSVESSESYNSNFSGTYISGDYEESYNTALDLFRNHDYQQSIATFFQLLQSDPKHPLADNCQYWIGESRYAEGKFYQAVVEFNKVFAYDAPDKQDDAQLMLGMAYLKLGELNIARTEFDWLVSCYVSSEYVNTAHRYLGQL